MPQSPQTHLDAISQFRKECQAASTPVLKSSPRLNYSTRLMGLSWRAGMVIGILLILFINQGAAAAPAAVAGLPGRGQSQNIIAKCALHLTRCHIAKRFRQICERLCQKNQRQPNGAVLGPLRYP